MANLLPLSLGAEAPGSGWHPSRHEGAVLSGESNFSGRSNLPSRSAGIPAGPIGAAASADRSNYPGTGGSPNQAAEIETNSVLRHGELGAIFQPVMKHLSSKADICAEKLAGEGAVRYQAADSCPPTGVG